MSNKPKDLTRPPFQKRKRNKSRGGKKPYNLSPRSKMERWFDRHNHKMEFLRTLFGLATVALQIVILLKLFQFI